MDRREVFFDQSLPRGRWKEIVEAGFMLMGIIEQWYDQIKSETLQEFETNLLRVLADIRGSVAGKVDPSVWDVAWMLNDIAGRAPSIHGSILESRSLLQWRERHIVPGMHRMHDAARADPEFRRELLLLRRLKYSGLMPVVTWGSNPPDARLGRAAAGRPPDLGEIEERLVNHYRYRIWYDPELPRERWRDFYVVSWIVSMDVLFNVSRIKHGTYDQFAHFMRRRAEAVRQLKTQMAPAGLDAEWIADRLESSSEALYRLVMLFRNVLDEPAEWNADCWGLAFKASLRDESIREDTLQVEEHGILDRLWPAPDYPVRG